MPEWVSVLEPTQRYLQNRKEVDDHHGARGLHSHPDRRADCLDRICDSCFVEWLASVVDTRRKTSKSFFFGEYLKYGLWPFLTTFVLSLVVIPMMLVLMIPVVIGAGMAEGGNEEVGVILAVIGMLLYFGAIVLMMLFSCHAALRADDGFQSRLFVGIYRKLYQEGRMEPDLVLPSPSFDRHAHEYCGLFRPFGWCLRRHCLVQMVMNHILFQHYDLYLKRGGEPIQFASELVKELEAPPAS